MSIVRIENVGKIFQEDSIPVTALSEINIEISKGSFVALSGPSGSGKTTLLNLIGCLDVPSSGKIFLDGLEITKLPQKELARVRLRRIGFVFQDYNLIPTFTAAENIEYVLWLQGISPKERRARVLALGERFGIAGLLQRFPSRLSRGQQQRVAVARAVVHEPCVVLGDELTANLDHKTGALLMDFLKELNQEKNITFLYATHDPVMVERANRIIRMEDGRIISMK